MRKHRLKPFLFLLSMSAILTLFWVRGCTAKHRSEAEAAIPTKESRREPTSILTGLQREIGLVHTPITSRNLRLSIEPKPWCSPGDLDAMWPDLEHGTDKTMLLSIEPVLTTDTSFKPITRVLSKNELWSGIQFDLPRPRPENTTQLGVFICRDSAKAGRCSGKPLMPINDIFRQYNQERARYKPSDKIYYFQYLLADKNSITTFLSPKTELPFATARKLYLYLSQVSQHSNDAKLTLEAIERTRSLIKALASLPLNQKEDRLTVTLPVFDKRTCPSRGSEWER